jgi:hypothetical protein
VSRLLDRREAESVAELRVVEGRRLDAMQAAVWDTAVRGDLDAIKAVLGIMARRARLFGLDMPTTLAVGVSEVEFGARAAELLAVVGSEPLRELASVAVSARALPDATTAAMPDVGLVYDGEVDEEWSNVGADSAPCLGSLRLADDEPTEIIAGLGMPSETPEDVSLVGRTPPPTAESLPGPPQAENDADGDQPEPEPEPAAIGPLRPGTRRIPASAVLGRDGAPVRGMSRRITDGPPGRYDPLAGLHTSDGHPIR